MTTKFHDRATGPTLHGCSAKDCIRPTRGHYCVDHARWCKSCGDEYEAGDLTIDGECDRCVRLAAGEEETDVYGDGGLGLPVSYGGVRRFG